MKANYYYTVYSTHSVIILQIRLLLDKNTQKGRIRALTERNNGNGNRAAQQNIDEVLQKVTKALDDWSTERLSRFRAAR